MEHEEIIATESFEESSEEMVAEITLPSDMLTLQQQQNELLIGIFGILVFFSIVVVCHYGYKFLKMFFDF